MQRYVRSFALSACVAALVACGGGGSGDGGDNNKPAATLGSVPASGGQGSIPTTMSAQTHAAIGADGVTSHGDRSSNQTGYETVGPKPSSTTGADAAYQQAAATAQQTAGGGGANSAEASPQTNGSNAQQPSLHGSSQLSQALPAFSDIPASNAEAARFLTQATFGPTTDDIAYLRKVGYSRWIDEQLDPVRYAPTLIEPHILAIPDSDLNAAERRNYWLWKAVSARDQLRLRMGFALSEIFVISDLELGPQSRIANYQDMLDVNAFGSYRLLLEKVSLHPMMGSYLSHLQNQKATSFKNSKGQMISIVPDENFAREVMQLFSIGLLERNPDYSLKLDANGDPIPTYDQDVVAAMARVFTGWTWATNTTSFTATPSDRREVRPMICDRRYHDAQPKVIFRGIVINEGDNCTASLAKTLDALSQHPSTAPFISRQLIQRFVTSNPSPAYVARVTSAWNDSNGNLGKVLKTILLDPEARIQTENPAFGKMKEPIIQMTSLWRAFNSTYAGRKDGSWYFKMTYAPNYLTSLGQDSLRSQSVFNFFTPNNQLPATSNGFSVYAPEFQIYDEWRFTGVLNAQGILTNYQDMDGTTPIGIDTPLINTRALVSMAQAGNHVGMVDLVNTLLFAGGLHPDDAKVMVRTLDQVKKFHSDKAKVRTVLALAYANPDYVIQR